MVKFFETNKQTNIIYISYWTARRSNQSIVKEINPEYSLEGLMLKLKLQHFGHLMQRVDSLEKTLMMGKTEGRRRRGYLQINGHEFEQTPGDSRGQECLACCSPWDRKETKVTQRLNNNKPFHLCIKYFLVP